MPLYIHFLEQHLGRIVCGWSEKEFGERMPFQIVKFSEGPIKNTVCYGTLGLSFHTLHSPISGKPIHHEIFFLAREDFGTRNIPGILFQARMLPLKDHHALLRGSVIGPYGQLFQGSNMEALYVSVPVYFQDSFHLFEEEGKDPIVQAWVFPITRKEVHYIDVYGWEKFEDVLVEKDPDLLDFTRESVV